MKNKPMIEVALEQVAKGQPVFPCRWEGEGHKLKAPLTKNGFKDATLDVEQVKRWWTKWPKATVGIPTGIKWDVLDVDVKGESDGRARIPRLNRLGLINGCKRLVRTPSGGFHLYFKATKGLTNKARGSLGLDVRSKGGYVLAPGSLNSVGRYVDEGKTKDSTDDPLLWDLILTDLTPVSEDDGKTPIALLPSDRQRSIAALREWTANLKPGDRNPGLFWATNRCLEAGIDPYELLDSILLTGLPEDECTFLFDETMKRAGFKRADLKSEAEALFGG